MDTFSGMRLLTEVVEGGSFSAAARSLGLAPSSVARGIGTLEIKKRGVDVDPAALRTRLGLRGPESATLLLTRAGGRRLALLADRV